MNAADFSLNGKVTLIAGGVVVTSDAAEYVTGATIGFDGGEKN